MHPEWWASRARTGTPGRPSSGFVTFLRRVVAPVVRVAHRPALEGVENLPPAGPYVLVANHSAGLAVAEILSFAALYLERVGEARPIAGFAHPGAFHVWPASAFLRGAGAVPSSRRAGEDALAAGVALLVFPGGDHEAFRPVWQAHRVDFGGRVGFLRMARAAGVPVVPMGIRGSHFTAPILGRSRALAWALVTPRLFGVKRWPVTLLGALVAAAIVGLTAWAWPWKLLAAWAFLGSPFALLAWIPATVRMRVGRPFAPGELFGDGSDDALPEALARVEGAVQGLVTALGAPTARPAPRLAGL